MVKPFDFWIAIAALLGVLSAGVLLGVVIGMILSLGWLIYVATRPAMPLLGREPGTQVYRDIEQHPDGEATADVVVLRIDGGLFFATAEAVDDRVRAVTDGRPGIRTLVLDLEGVDFVDAQGAGKLTEILGLLRAGGRSMRLARVKPSVLTVLEAEGLIDDLGRDHIHGNVHRAVEAHEHASQSPPGV